MCLRRSIVPNWEWVSATAFGDPSMACNYFLVESTILEATANLLLVSQIEPVSGVHHRRGVGRVFSKRSDIGLWPTTSGFAFTFISAPHHTHSISLSLRLKMYKKNASLTCEKNLLPFVSVFTTVDFMMSFVSSQPLLRPSQPRLSWNWGEIHLLRKSDNMHH